MGERFNMDEKNIMDIYDDIVSFFPEYKSMINQIANQSSGRTLEIGVGTGLLTKKLLANKRISKLVLIEISKDFIKKFHEKFPKINVKQSDGLFYQEKHQFDAIVMSLVYHHIRDEDKLKFLRNMYKNLSYRGRIIIGDLFIPPYNTEIERDNNLRIFHEDRLKRIGNSKIRETEIQALKDGLHRDGEWKTSCDILEGQLKEMGFKNINLTEIGRQEFGGHGVVVAAK